MADVETLKLPQRTIKVAVEYYDEAEKRELANYPTAQQIEGIVKDGLEISTEQFLTYYLFHDKRPGKEGWRNYREVGTKVGRAITWLEEWIDFNGDSISTPADVDFQDRATTERVGESIGLSVISEIHGLTAADWDRVPEQPGRSGVRTFDYRIASDTKNIIQVETKGTSFRDGNDRSATVANHRRNIATKKSSIAASQRLRQYPFPANLRYGTITVMSSNRRKPVKCLLVDPPADGDPEAARRLRVLLRLRFLRDWITFISPRSQLAAALQTRLIDLESLPNPLMLDGVPLVRGNGQPFEFFPVSGWPGGHSWFFARKSKVTDGPDGGVVVPLPDGNLFFLGLRESLVELAASQQLRQLAEIRSERGPVEKTIQCVLTERSFERLRLPSTVREQARTYGGYVEFELNGTIHYSDGGTLFGVLPTAEDVT